MNTKKHLVLYSGGLDSFVLLWWLARNTPEYEGITCLTVNDVNNRRHKLPYKISQLEDREIVFLRADVDIVPCSDFGKREDAYVPGRNLMLLSVAVQNALYYNYTHIYIGGIQHSWYDDSSPTFTNKFHDAVVAGYSKHHRMGGIPEIVIPFKNKTKADLMSMLLQFCDRDIPLFDAFITDTECCGYPIETKHYWGKGCGECYFCDKRRKWYDVFREETIEHNKKVKEEALGTQLELNL